jgi:hypothetical protein
VLGLVGEGQVLEGPPLKVSLERLVATAWLDAAFGKPSRVPKAICVALAHQNALRESIENY